MKLQNTSSSEGQDSQGCRQTVDTSHSKCSYFLSDSVLQTEY